MIPHRTSRFGQLTVYSASPAGKSTDSPSMPPLKKTVTSVFCVETASDAACAIP